MIRTAADIAALQDQPYERYQPQANVWQALQQAAATHAHRPALTFIDSPDPAVAATTWTYRELADHVARAAALFTRLAAPEAPRVAMLLPNIPQAWWTLLGAEAAGVFCPVNYLLGTEHVAELMNATGANVLVALGPHAELDIWSKAASLRDACPALRHVLVVGEGAALPGTQSFDAALAGEPAAAFTSTATRDTLAALFHTGGTTGLPKLAQHLHGNQLHAALGAGQMFGLRSDDVVINGFPLFHVAGSFVYGLSTLLGGAELVLPTLLGMRNKAFVERYWQFIAKHRITLLSGVPTVMSTLVSAPVDGPTPPCARAMLTGGAPLPDDLAEAFEQRFGMPVRNILGMTECAGVISIEPLARERVRGSCGLPLPYTEVQAIDADGQPLPSGQTGVLRVRGPNVGPGYSDARRNAGTFEQGWLVTGDIGHVDAAGRVYITGRAKDVIVRGGHNIDPRTIEDALMRHPAVEIAAAVGQPDDYAGELPVAYVVLKPGMQADIEDIARFAQQHIPERPAFPKWVEQLPALPVTAVGKVFKPALRQAATARAMAQRLADAGIEDVTVDVRDDNGVAVVVFTPEPTARTVDLPERLKALMTPFALRWEIAA